MAESGPSTTIKIDAVSGRLLEKRILADEEAATSKGIETCSLNAPAHSSP